MSMMNELLKSTSLKSENGDATSTYDCELARDNITVREFVEAVENSVNKHGQKFNEWWATVSMSIIGQDRFPACAEYTIYGDTSSDCFSDISLNGTPATIDDILSHYGKYIIGSCLWNGGWGSGGYYLKIKKEENRTMNPTTTSRPVLDACCGSRMFWFDANDTRALFVDCRRLKSEAIWKSGNGLSTRYCDINPDILADFRKLPFPDESFYHVVFDPPHLKSVGDNAWMAKKYGKLPDEWEPLIRDGFRECWRVLKTNGTLIFKWNEIQIPVSKVLSCIDAKPLYGHKSGRQSKTHWMAFIKTK